MLFWLEAFSLNRAPLLGGDRFFTAISSASISDRFSDRSRLRSKKLSKKISKRIRNWKTEVCWVVIRATRQGVNR